MRGRKPDLLSRARARKGFKGLRVYPSNAVTGNAGTSVTSVIPDARIGRLRTHESYVADARAREDEQR
jgi:hypothetical protein